MHDPRSSAADWSVFGEDWSGGVAIVPNVWCHWLDWVIVLCFLFFFFFLMVVPSYLLVHSICTKKLD